MAAQPNAPAAPSPGSELEIHGGGTRFYRSFEDDRRRRVPFHVQVDTTDLYLRADRDLAEPARAAARRARTEVEDCIRRHPAFATALQPLELPHRFDSHLVNGMVAAARAAGVGPMAAVAGAIAEAVGRELRSMSREVIVENGGDVYLDLERDAVVGLYAGSAPFSGKLGLRVRAAQTPLAVCTSSGRVGPSLSFGAADAAVAIGTPAALADAVATAVGNRVRDAGDLAGAVEWALGIDGVHGVVVVVGEQLAAAGAVEFTEIAA